MDTELKKSGDGQNLEQISLELGRPRRTGSIRYKQTGHAGICRDKASVWAVDDAVNLLELEDCFVNSISERNFIVSIGSTFKMALEYPMIC